MDLIGTDSATNMKNRRSKFWVPKKYLTAAPNFSRLRQTLGLSSDRLPGRFEK